MRLLATSPLLTLLVDDLAVLAASAGGVGRFDVVQQPHHRLHVLPVAVRLRAHFIFRKAGSRESMRDCITTPASQLLIVITHLYNNSIRVLA